MTAHTSKMTLIAAALFVALNGCGGSGGKTGSGASAGSGAGFDGATATSGSGGAVSSGGASPASAGEVSSGASARGGAPATSSAGAGGIGGSAATGGVGPVAQSGAAGISGLAGAGVGGVGGNGGQAGSSTAGSTQRGGASGAGGQSTGGRPISFGTLLEPQAVITAARQRAQSLANPGSSQWRAKGDQHRRYRFAEANVDAPYRLYVPTAWDGQSKLPLVMFLHGAGSNENTYIDQNGGQILDLAEQHGYLLVAPLGSEGAYGNFLRLASPFGKPDEAAKLMAQVTAESERTNQLSEQDVINVLELVLSEYPVDQSSMFLTGHSMGSGGTWYIGGKYASYWKGLAPMSGPFVQESGYPWESLRAAAFFRHRRRANPLSRGKPAARGLAREERLRGGVQGSRLGSRRYGEARPPRRLRFLRSHLVPAVTPGERLGVERDE